MMHRQPAGPVAAVLASVALVAAALVAVGVATLAAVGVVGVGAFPGPEFPTNAGYSAVSGRMAHEKPALVGNFEWSPGFEPRAEPGPGVVPRAATMSPIPSPSPTGSAPTSGGPDFRFILLGIGCILFAIVVARRGKREGKSERNWF